MGLVPTERLTYLLEVAEDVVRARTGSRLQMVAWKRKHVVKSVVRNRFDRFGKRLLFFVGDRWSWWRFEEE